MCFIFSAQTRKDWTWESKQWFYKQRYVFHVPLVNKMMKKIFFTVLSLVWCTFLCFSHCGLWQDAAVDPEVRQCKHKFAGILKFSYQAQLFYDKCRVMFCTQTSMHNTTVKTSTEEWLYNVDECCHLSKTVYSYLLILVVSTSMTSTIFRL